MNQRIERILESIELSKVLNPGLKYIAVHGLRENGECTCGKNHSDPKEKGKHPVHNRWQESSTNDLATISGWFRVDQDFNIAIDCAGSGIFAIDVDPRSAGHKSLIKLEERSNFSLDKTVTAITGAYKVESKTLRGTHYLYECDRDEKFLANLKKQGMPGIDIKHHGYIVISGSQHFSGVSYAWAMGLSPADISITKAPEELLALLRSQAHSSTITSPKNPNWNLLAAQALDFSPRDIAASLKNGLVEGERAVEIYSLTCSLANRFGTDDVARDLITRYMLDWNQTSVKPPLETSGPNSLLMHVGRAIEFVASNPLSLPAVQTSSLNVAQLRDTTDASVVEWLATIYKDDYCWSRMNSWLHFVDGVWTSMSDESLRETLRMRLLDYHIAVRTDPLTAHIAQSIKGMLGASKIKNYELLLRGALEVGDAQFNSFPDYLNVKNGIVDLTSGKLLPHDPSFYFTQIAPTDFVANASHPDWDRALSAIPEYSRDWVQVFLGQACTGHTVREDLMVIFTGGGRNGKSTIVNVPSAVLGSFAVQVSDRILSARDGDHSTDLTDLHNKRFAVLEEFPSGKVNSKRLKEIVGTNNITARRMRQDNQTFKATHTFVLTTNFEPQISSGDEGTWRRLVKINFPYRYVPEPKLANDRPVILGLRERIQEGLEGQHKAALAWLIRGAVRWYQNDKKLLTLPHQVIEATSEWRKGQDVLGTFLNESIETADGFFVAQEDLLREFASLNPREIDASSNNTLITQIRSHEFFQVNGLKFERLRHASLKLSRPQSALGPLPAQTTLIRGIRFKP